MSLIQLIKDIIAPKKCYSCNKEGHFLCEKCSLVLRKSHQVCYICKKQSYQAETHFLCNNNIFYDAMYVEFDYNNKIIKKIIHDFKFYNKKDIAEDLGKLISLNMNNISSLNKNTYIVYPPMGFFKRIKRGYNQAELLSLIIGKNTGIKVIKSLFRLSRHKRQQSHLNKAKREENMQGSFKINKKLNDIVDKNNFIIIDDVVSTGSTINELAKILKQNGAHKVTGYIISAN